MMNRCATQGKATRRSEKLLLETGRVVYRVAGKCELSNGIRVQKRSKGAGTAPKWRNEPITGAGRPAAKRIGKRAHGK